MYNYFKKISLNNKRGFTIIEVLVVLTIASVIMVVVLVAFPTLQRNQRNQTRRAIASNIYSEIINYASSNLGNYPTATIPAVNHTDIGQPGDAIGFFNRYFGCTNATAVECLFDINDPVTGTPVGSTPLTADVAVVGGEPGTEAGSTAYAPGLRCDGEVPETAGLKTFVFQMRLEGGAVYCLDNS